MSSGNVLFSEANETGNGKKRMEIVFSRPDPNVTGPIGKSDIYRWINDGDPEVVFFPPGKTVNLWTP